MSLLIPEYILEEYNEIFATKRDKRTDGWFLMDSPLPTLIMCLIYVIVVKYLGPMYMKNRPPYQLKKLLVFYNGFQVVFSVWQFYEFGAGGWFGYYNFRCQPVDKSNNERANRMVRVLYWYYISKISEFFDTFFFVLKKKGEHVSFLQVFHHGVMPINAWLATRFAPGGHCTLIGFTNTFIHSLMYFYYMMAAMGPQYQKYLWWKKYLTFMQMLQFVIVFIHSMQLFFIDCDVPIIFAWLTVFHTAAFLLLFMDYFRKAYSKRVHKKPNDSKSNGKSLNDQRIINQERWRKPSVKDPSQGTTFQEWSNFLNSVDNIKIPVGILMMAGFIGWWFG